MGKKIFRALGKVSNIATILSPPVLDGSDQPRRPFDERMPRRDPMPKLPGSILGGL